MATEPHLHQVPLYYGIGGFVLFTFAQDVDEHHAFRYSTSHTALVYPEQWFDRQQSIDLRGQQYGAIITHIYDAPTIQPLYDLLVQTRYGSFFFQGVRHKNESETLAYCAIGCLNSNSPGCSHPGFCNPQPGDPIAPLPCPITDNALCRWQQVKVGYWEELPIQFTGLPV